MIRPSRKEAARLRSVAAVTVRRFSPEPSARIVMLGCAASRSAMAETKLMA